MGTGTPALRGVVPYSRRKTGCNQRTSMKGPSRGHLPPVREPSGRESQERPVPSANLELATDDNPRFAITTPVVHPGLITQKREGGGLSGRAWSRALPARCTTSAMDPWSANPYRGLLIQTTHGCPAPGPRGSTGRPSPLARGTGPSGREGPFSEA